jgi:1-acyl-sn-glycerol-3-phosphate acyltransferase
MIYFFKLLLVGLITLPSSLLIVLVSPFGRKGKPAHAVSRLWAWSILKAAGVRLTVRGLERLDPGRHYIFIANHQSYLDIPVLVQSLPQFQLRWIAKKELGYIPLFGWALWASGHILVDRSDRASAMTSLRRARERIAAGVSVVIFPEGTRSSGGQVMPFKRGGFLLAAQSKTPIVPVTINGSWKILARDDWRLKSGEIEVVVDAPISIEKYDGKAIGVIVRRVHDGIESHCGASVRPHAKSPAGADISETVISLEMD